MSESEQPELPAVDEYDLLRWGESLAGIARTGLGFTSSLYERNATMRC